MEAARIQSELGGEPILDPARPKPDSLKPDSLKPDSLKPDSLKVVASRFRPLTLATDQILPVLGPLGDVLPDGGLRRGTVLTLEGTLGQGATTLALDLAAAVTAAGEWAALVQLDWQSSRSQTGGWGIAAPAAMEAGVAFDRLAVVRRVPLERWSVVVAALVEGVGLVITDLPARVRLGDARRIAARARERGSILVALGEWPERAAVRLRPQGGAWRMAGGRLDGRDLMVEVEGRGRPPRRVRVA